MGLNEIIEIIRKFGIEIRIDENGFIKAVDMDNNEEMIFYGNAMRTVSPLSKNENSINSALDNGHSISFKSDGKFIEFGLSYSYLNDETNNSNIILNKLIYFDNMEKKKFDIDFREGLNPTLYVKESYDNGFKAVEVDGSGRGIIFNFSDGKQVKHGRYTNGFSNNSQMISEEQMLEFIHSNDTLKLLIDYYSKLYPKLHEQYDTVFETKKTYI